MRKRIFSSIFLTAFITLLLTAGLLLAAVYSGLSRDVRERLEDESSHIAAIIEEIGSGALGEVGRSYADRITVIAANGAVLYDNRTDAASMENHLVRPEVAAALQTGVGQSSRLSDTLETQTYYHARRLEDGTVLRVASTADSAFGALSSASPWIVLIVLLALLVAALLAGRLTGAFIAPIAALDLQDPLKNEAYDELSPLLQRMAKQNRKIEIQMRELKRRQAEFDDVTARMDEGLVLFSPAGEIVFANRAACALFPEDSAKGSYLNLCRDAEYVRVVRQALDGAHAHGRMEKNGRVYELTASSAGEQGPEHAAALFLVDVTEREQAEQQRREFSANVSHELKTPLTSIMGYAEIMENGIVKPEDIGRFSGKIRAEAVRLLGLIEDIIRLSQLDEGGAAGDFAPVGLLALCGSVRDRLLHKAAENRVTLTV
ncbi:MAG: histidine kinase dimerization/phospho-acceptor domain-containing protein, partial [Agathobaculum sp.]|uniref:histidine kinase dimerization/phospho-acceptor domain-containing protein n=1 Tax=Agathobaculum sp. TaxID=2048138 RepID=UPI003D8A2937